MAIQSKKIIQELKSLFAGIDVGAEELILTIRKNGTPYKAQKFANTHADRARLVKKMVSMPGIIVCLEATGVYHFDLSIALHDAGVALMVVNPKSSRNFAKVLMKNSKTDAIDAETLAQYAERMNFVAWTRPSDEKIALRSFARRIDALTRQKAVAKNNCHALSVSQETPEAVLRDVKLAISQLEKRIERLAKDALDLIGKHPELERVSWGGGDDNSGEGGYNPRTVRQQRDNFRLNNSIACGSNIVIAYNHYYEKYFHFRHSSITSAGANSSR